jgi:hypothetical protein
MKNNICRIFIMLEILAMGTQLPAQESLQAYYTKVNKGESWEKESRTTEHADIVVELKTGKLVFWRGTSYLPLWETEYGSWSVNEIIERKGDGPKSRPDSHNTFSSVRIIESGKDKVWINWRYLPKFSPGNPKRDVNHLDFVEEDFFIYADGDVDRTIRQGTPKIDDWIYDINSQKETFTLSSRGIINQMPVPTKNHNKHSEIIGNPILKAASKSPSLNIRFDKGTGDAVIESVTSHPYLIEGCKSYWKKGVSGTALAFDGYESQIRIPSSEVPMFNHFTLKAWVSLGAYPYNWAPIIHQSDWRSKGFYLGVDATGRIGFRLQSGTWKELTTLYELPLRQWVQVTATYDGKAMKIFVNGKEKGSLAAPELPEFSASDLIIGRNSHKFIPFNPVRIYCHECHTPALYSLDGLIDEIALYDRALTEAEIEEDFRSTFPGFEIVNYPDMDHRKLPNGQLGAKFEAYYTHLRYYDTWDNLSRFGKHCDIVVEFDENPTRFIFWRGMSFIPQITNPENQWYNNQFNESWDPGGSWGEPMSDKKSNISHVRLIENTPARKVIHWRYAQIQINGTQQNLDKKTGWSDWSDWYYYIYPDGVACKRMVHWSSDDPESHEWQESIGVMEPGQTPESISDVYHNTVTLANFKTSKSYDWSEESPVVLEADWETTPLQIQQINYKSEYKPFTIADFSGGELYGDADGRRAPYSRMVVYTHWPIGQLPTDGVRAIKADRTSSNGYTHLMFEGSDKKGRNWAQRHMLEGMNSMSIEELRVLAASWLHPADLKNIGGGESSGYDQSQRAYVIKTLDKTVSFTLMGSEDHPIENPCFVLKNWPGSDLSTLTINGRKVEPGKDLRQGIITDTDGTETLVVYTKFSATSPTDFHLDRQIKGDEVTAEIAQ